MGSKGSSLSGIYESENSNLYSGISIMAASELRYAGG